MNATVPAPAKATAATWAGLAIALFAILIIRCGVSMVSPPDSFAAVVAKEFLIWICVAAVLWIIRRSEGLPFQSVDLGTAIAQP